MRLDELGVALREQRLLVAFTAPDKATHFMGLGVSYLDQPSVQIRDENGCVHAWAASLVREATPDEAIAYWRERANAAEMKLQELQA